MNDDIEFLRGKAVYIFGVGLSGKSAYQKLKNSVNVKGFLDNNEDLLGTSCEDIKIQTPSRWNASGESYDYVLIASEHFESIKNQLRNDFSVPHNKIVILPARITKPVNLGQSEELKDNAYKVLFKVAEVFEQRKVNYYVDAGTLLGIHRDGKLIPWDDDIDISVNAADIDNVRQALEQVVAELAELFGVKWTVDNHYSGREFGAVPEGAIRGFKVRALEPDARLPMMDIFVKYVQGEEMDYTLSSRGIRMPSQHLLQTVLVNYLNHTIRFPSDVEGYLTAHYGDWRTPVKDWNLSMLQNSTVY